MRSSLRVMVKKGFCEREMIIKADSPRGKAEEKIMAVMTKLMIGSK